MSPTKIPVYVMSHTHWDRAWYLPFEGFRRALVKVCERLIENFAAREDYRQFVFDGQTVVLEDYLAIRPDREEVIRRLVQARRLRVGPFYMLPDEFLAGQEALVRNALIGRAVAERFGEPMPVGYVADPFGHPDQMPQILRGLGLDSIVFSRGIGPEIDPARSEFRWQAPDGAEVYAIWQHNWYASASYLGYPTLQGSKDPTIFRLEDGVRQLLDQAEDYTTKTCVGAIVLYNGVDHEMPETAVIDMIAQANARSDKFEFIHSDMLPFLEKVRAARDGLQVYRGKLRSGKHTGLLGGSLATRMYLKQAQQHLETLLALRAEPMAAMALTLTGHEYPKPFFDYAWKLHLKNLPHDDICGCSVDETHQDGEARNRNATKVAEGVNVEAARALAEQIDASSQPGTPFVVINTLPFRRDIQVDHLDFRASLWDGERPFRIVDEAGRPLSCFLRGAEFTRQLGHQSIRDMRRAHVEMTVPNVPGLGWRVFYAQEGEAAAGARNVVIEGRRVRTPLLEIVLNDDGTIDLTDKASGKHYAGLNALRDVADRGDDYNFDALPGDTMIAPRPLSPWTAVSVSGDGATLETTVVMSLPEALDADRMHRATATRNVPVTVRLSVRAASTRVDFEARLANTCEDHKLMALFPTGILSECVGVDETFGLFEKAVATPTGEAVADWKEKPLAQCPVKGFVTVGGESVSKNGGCAVFNGGMPEFESMRAGDGSVVIAQTLFRSVGWLSRPDLFIRDHNGGVEVPAPEGQCLRDFVFRYAFMPFAGLRAEAGLYAAAVDFAVPGHVIPLRDRETDPDPMDPETKDRFVPRPAAGPRPAVFGLVEVGGGNFAVSTVKRAEESDALILRIYNPEAKAQTLRLDFGLPVAKAEWVELDERRVVEMLTMTDNCKLSLALPGYKIATLRVRFAPEGCSRP